MNQIVHGRHSVGGSNYHLQFTPKYRRRVFEDYLIREECRRQFHEVAMKLGVTLECVEFGHRSCASLCDWLQEPLRISTGTVFQRDDFEISQVEPLG